MASAPTLCRKLTLPTSKPSTRMSAEEPAGGSEVHASPIVGGCRCLAASPAEPGGGISFGAAWCSTPAPAHRSPLWMPQCASPSDLGFLGSRGLVWLALKPRTSMPTHLAAGEERGRTRAPIFKKKRLVNRTQARASQWQAAVAATAPATCRRGARSSGSLVDEDARVAVDHGDVARPGVEGLRGGGAGAGHGCVGSGRALQQAQRPGALPLPLPLALAPALLAPGARTSLNSIALYPCS